MELDRMLKSAPVLEKSPCAAPTICCAMPIAVQRPSPIPEESLRAALKQALPGQNIVIGCVMSAVHVSNMTRKPLTLLLMDEEEITAWEIIR